MITRQDLADIGDKDFEKRRGEFIQCQDCNYEFGGTRGDYFLMKMDEVFICPICENKNLAIVRRVFTTKIIKQ